MELSKKITSPIRNSEQGTFFMVTVSLPLKKGRMLLPVTLTRRLKPLLSISPNKAVTAAFSKKTVSDMIRDMLRRDKFSKRIDHLFTRFEMYQM